jgi:hypothetical protein
MGGWHHDLGDCPTFLARDIRPATEKRVYIVWNAHGEYEDYRTDTLCAFDSRAKAEEFKTKAETSAKKLLTRHEKYLERLSAWTTGKPSPRQPQGTPEDRELYGDDVTSVKYYVKEMEVL